MSETENTPEVTEIPATLAWSAERRKEKRRFRAGGLIGLGAAAFLIRLILIATGSDRPSTGAPVASQTNDDSPAY